MKQQNETRQMMTVAQVIAARQLLKNETRYVANWREQIPKGSRWFPGCPGDPACTECEGTGYVREHDVPVGHRDFGKIHHCECVARMKAK